MIVVIEKPLTKLRSGLSLILIMFSGLRQQHHDTAHGAYTNPKERSASFRMKSGL